MEPDDLIRIAIERRLDFGNFPASLVQLCDMYAKAGFNDQAKYGMLRKAAKLNNRLADYIRIKGPTHYRGMKDANVQFVKNSEMFQPSPKRSVEPSLQTMDPELFTKRPANFGSASMETVRDDMKGLETKFDNRMDLITYQLESLT